MTGTPEQEAAARQQLRMYFESVFIATRLPDMDTLPKFDLEQFLGDAWFTEMSRRFKCDARALMREASPRMLEELGRAVLRLLVV